MLSIAFPFAPVGPDAVGGAEQVLTHLDAALVRAGHLSIVVAAEGSSTHGILVPVPRQEGELDRSSQAAVHAATRRAIQHVLATYPVDLMHLHGVDFDRYLPAGGPPALITLHLPPFSYASAALSLERPTTFLQPVSWTQYAGLPAASMNVLEPIENGVPLEQLHMGEAKAEFALALGRICPEKGFHLAARAARLARIPLKLGGQVYAYPTHQAYVSNVLAPMFDDHWFQFLGPVGLERKRQLLAQARCLLVPSQITETSSLVAMEAAACGTPVVAFRAGALPEIVEHGRTGFLVDSVKEMAEAIGHVDEIDPRECRRVAEARFSVDRMAERYLERYVHIVDRHTSEAPLSVTELCSRDALEDVRGEWTDLWNRCGTSVFQHPDWLIAWCRPFNVHEPWLLAFRRGQRLVGVAPMLVYPRGEERVLTLMGAGISDDQDFLTEPASRAAVLHAFWNHLAQHAARFDCVELENLPEHSALLGPAPAKWHTEGILQQDVRPVLALGSRIEDVCPRDVLRDVRYQTRRAEREGLPVRFETATPDSVERLFDVLLRLHRARWHGKGTQGMLDGELESFHREIARRFARHGLLRLHVLWLGDRPAAAFYGYHARGRTLYYLGGFDPCWARFSPGKLVVAHAIEHAMTQDGAIMFDFLRGAEAYKYAWGAVDQPLFERRLVLESGVAAHAA